MRRAKHVGMGALLVALIAYACASLLSHVHSAWLLSAYPNLPSSLSVFSVYAAWAAVSAVGLVGYLLLRQRYLAPGLIALGIYGASGLDGLVHYAVAEFSAHPPIMHALILLEAITGVVLIGLTIATAVHSKRVRMMRS